ncbi:MAG: peptidylprolyl isomerase [Pseudomonadota bacterium]
MHARIDTELGPVVFRLETRAAPRTCAYMAEIVASGAWDGASFFRIVAADNAQWRKETPIELVQGGLRDTDPQPVAPVDHEGTDVTGLTHRRGTVSAARYGPKETYGSFFICMRDEPALDCGGARHPDGRGFAAFGQVADGFNVVQSIFNRRSGTEFVERPVRIISACLVAHEADANPSDGRSIAT